MYIQYPLVWNPKAKSRSTIKPILTTANMARRVQYCKSFVNADGCFNDLLDRLDIDEKWWYISKVSTGYIVVPGEIPPDRRCKHKSHLIKVMCLTAMAHPRQNPEPGEWWDGKIGTWFFTTKVRAKRSSRNRAAGTLETKTVKVNREVFVQKCIDDLLPAIEEKWPAWCPKRVRIQQDNATPHPPPGTNAKINAVLAAMATRGWDIQFVAQPHNSPDCNTEDLAFFRAIQSIQWTKTSDTIDKLITHVLEAFQELPLDVCKKVWTTAQMVMNEIIRCNGNNNYKLPHAGKDKVVRKMRRDIPFRLPCQALLMGGALNGDVIVAFMVGGEIVASPTPRLIVASEPVAAPPAAPLVQLVARTTAPPNVVSVREGGGGNNLEWEEEEAVGGGGSFCGRGAATSNAEHSEMIFGRTLMNRSPGAATITRGMRTE